MRFALIDGAKAEFPIHRLCRVLGISQSGYFAWRGRLVCRRQRDDMVLLAHARSAFALSNGTYGSPRMTRELRDGGLTVGRRRIARLMRQNGLRARQKRRFKRTTDSHHAWPGSGVPTSPTCGRAKVGCTSPLSSTCSPAGSSAGQQPTGCIGTWLSLRNTLTMRRPAAGLIHHSDSKSVPASCSWAA
jgi:putative transposase